MSAGIRINANACWLKADWLAQYVADELRSECTPAVAARLEEVGKWPGAIADFCSASAEEMIDVRNVLLLLIERMQAAGPSTLNDPTFFPGALNGVNELLAAVQGDTRVLTASGNT
jgi:hypothetical protein